MDQRTKNRILEHSRPGHRLAKSDLTHTKVEVVKKHPNDNTQFFICSCGWEGWMPKTL